MIPTPKRHPNPMKRPAAQRDPFYRPPPQHVLQRMQKQGMLGGTDGKVHTVREGESSRSIAALHGVTLDALVSANRALPTVVHNGERVFSDLASGDRLRVPAAPPRRPRGNPRGNLAGVAMRPMGAKPPRASLSGVPMRPPPSGAAGDEGDDGTSWDWPGTCGDGYHWSVTSFSCVPDTSTDKYIPGTCPGTLSWQWDGTCGCPDGQVAVYPPIGEPYCTTPTVHSDGALPREPGAPCPAPYVPDPINPEEYCILDPTVDTSCPAGQVYDVYFQKCIPFDWCQEGSISGDPNACDPNRFHCPYGQHIDANGYCTNDTVGCPPGYGHSKVTGACVECTWGTNDDGTCKLCPPGLEYDQAGGNCYCVADGTAWDEASGACQPWDGCGPNAIYKDVDGMCYPTGTGGITTGDPPTPPPQDRDPPEPPDPVKTNDNTPATADEEGLGAAFWIGTAVAAMGLGYGAYRITKAKKRKSAA